MTAVKGRVTLKIRKRMAPPQDSSQICPSSQFSSKADLLAVNLDAHIDKVYEFQKDKERFFAVLRQALTGSTPVDFGSYGSPEYSPFKEGSFCQPISPYSFPQFNGLRIAAVDGGLAIRKHLGLQFSLVKAALVVYKFNATPKPVINYFPPLKDNNFYQFFTDIGVFKSDSGAQLAGLRRATAENQMVLKYLTSTPELPDILILDGSILPPPAPFLLQKNAVIMESYRECLRTYISIYKKCEARGVLLVGSVKDSYSTNFRDLLLRALPIFLKKYPALSGLRRFPYRQFLTNFTDSDLIYNLLPGKTRSCIFRYRKNLQGSQKKDIVNGMGAPGAHNPGSPQESDPGLFTADQSEFGSFLRKAQLDVYASYMQVTKMDEPLRLEFIGPNDGGELQRRMELIASLLYPLSAINPSCTLPVPQIEAHNVSHLPDQELDVITNQLEREYFIRYFAHNPLPREEFDISGSGPSLNRPFWSKRHDRMDSII